MANIRTRQRLDGSTAYAVQWVLGGGRPAGKPSQSETFSDEGRARVFKADVEAAGHQWPAGWVKGRGYVRLDTPSTPTITFETVAADYFAAQERRIRLGKKKHYTHQRDKRAYELHLAETFGAMPFEAIGPDDVANWVDMQLDLQAAPKSVRNRHGMLFTIMAHGQKQMLLRSDNPCEVTELPESQSRRHILFFQQGEWSLLRKCLRSDVHLLADTLLASAVRWGEATAIRVMDCTIGDDDTVHIEVGRAWSRRATDDPAPIDAARGETAAWKLGAPKNKRTRQVVVKGQTAYGLIEAIEGRNPSEYLFVTVEGNPWRYPDFHSERWKPAVAEAKRRGLAKHATIHMLRHTAVVWALADGVPIHVVSEMLGHASIQITYDVYGGLVNVHDAQMAQAMARAMIMVEQAITPAPSQAEVDARKVRTRPRRAS